MADLTLLKSKAPSIPDECCPLIDELIEHIDTIRLCIRDLPDEVPICADDIYASLEIIQDNAEIVRDRAAKLRDGGRYWYLAAKAAAA